MIACSGDDGAAGGLRWTKILFQWLLYRGAGDGGAETAPVSCLQVASGANARGWERGES